MIPIITCAGTGAGAGGAGDENVPPDVMELRKRHVMINAHGEDIGFTVQEGHPHEWSRLVGTSLPSPSDFAEHGEEILLKAMNYIVKARSVVILLRPVG